MTRGMGVLVGGGIVLVAVGAAGSGGWDAIRVGVCGDGNGGISVDLSVGDPRTHPNVMDMNKIMAKKKGGLFNLFSRNNELHVCFKPNCPTYPLYGSCDPYIKFRLLNLTHFGFSQFPIQALPPRAEGARMTRLGIIEHRRSTRGDSAQGVLQAAADDVTDGGVGHEVNYSAGGAICDGRGRRGLKKCLLQNGATPQEIIKPRGGVAPHQPGRFHGRKKRAIDNVHGYILQKNMLFVNQ
jgi:hypothetical protein